MSFCDAPGLGVLIGVQRQAASLDIALGLAAPRPHVAKVLRLTGLDCSFPMYGHHPGSGKGAQHRDSALRPHAAYTYSLRRHRDDRSAATLSSHRGNSRTAPAEPVRSPHPGTDPITPFRRTWWICPHRARSPPVWRTA
ncbi:STAS domain-containing protein [Nonomuraea sp. NPDC026600]|uniref:STAS domain-containing protein n=1 Tax=Nonomuraea sp. NPDC026600 TaxID=3155363 RepID=UPI0033CADCA3